MKKEKYDFQDFYKIIQQLRSEHGCSWDKAQTHESLRSCLVNETNEVLEGITIYSETGDAENLCEELGDVLLQVVLHSVIAEEEGIFTLEDVIQGVSEKMIRRHPHVFGDADPETMPTWEEIKQQEKSEKAHRWQDKCQKP